MAITVVCLVIAVIISETTSNTASAAIVVPIAISGAVQVDPVIPALAAIFGAVLCVVGVAIMANVVGLVW